MLSPITASLTPAVLKKPMPLRFKGDPYVWSGSLQSVTYTVPPPVPQNRGVYVDFGFAAVASTNQMLMTDGLSICTALAVIDPISRMHYLLHAFDSSPSSNDIKASLEKAATFGLDVTRSQLFIMPGPVEARSACGVGNIMGALHAIDPSLPEQVQFIRPPKQSGNRGLALVNGHVYLFPENPVRAGECNKHTPTMTYSENIFRVL